MPVEEEGPVLGGGGQLGGRGGDEAPETVPEGGADLAGGEGGLGPDAGDDGTRGVGVAAERGPAVDGRLEPADAGGLSAADRDQRVGL